MEEKNITEEFLYYLWKSRLYELPLRDQDEEIVEVIDPGQRNHDAGPDFFNARIRAEGIVWAGNVELHIKASDWYLHGHHYDPAYNNVILHVVLDADCMVNNARFEMVPTACLDFRPEMYRRYSGLIHHSIDIPCREALERVDMSGLKTWFENLLEERFSEKRVAINRALNQAKGSWEEVMYQYLARSFGQHVNAIPFEMLARTLPLPLFNKNNSRIRQVEALLFGQAGLLPAKAEDAYTRELKKLYREFQNRHKLQPMESHLWKFLRLRPMNFPGIRISQLAFLLNRYPDIFQDLTREERPWDIISSLEIRTSPYWDNHFIFGKKVRKCIKRSGTEFMHRLNINAVIPVHYTHEMHSMQSNSFSAWMESLNNLPGENNHTIRMWKALGIPARNAFYSQALLQLSNIYCKSRRCLSCYIGSQIVHPGFVSNKKKGRIRNV